MSWLTEDPIYIFLTGLFLTAVCGTIAFLSRNGWLWFLTALTVLVTAGLLVYEARVVTDREQLVSKLDQMLVCVRNNDVDGLAAFGSRSRQDTIDRLKAEMPLYTIRSCTLSRRRPPEIRETSPPTASLQFVAFVDVDASRSSYRYEGSVFRGVTLNWQKDPDGQWRIVDYSHYEAPLLGMGTGSESSGGSTATE